VEEEAWMGGRRGLKLRESFGDGGKIEERGESFFYFIKIMGWEAQCFPTKKPNFRVSVGG
jgi:hypothetical protein